VHDALGVERAEHEPDERVAARFDARHRHGAIDGDEHQDRAAPSRVPDREIHELGGRRRLPAVARFSHGLFEERVRHQVEADGLAIPRVRRLEKDRRTVHRARVGRPHLDRVAIQVERPQQPAKVLPADALGEPDSLHAGIAFAELQPADEAAEFGAIDFRVGREQHRACAHDLGIGIQTGLQVPQRLLRVGLKLGSRLCSGGFGGGCREIPARTDRQPTRQRKQDVGNESPEEEFPQSHRNVGIRGSLPPTQRSAGRGLHRVADLPVTRGRSARRRSVGSRAVAPDRPPEASSGVGPDGRGRGTRTVIFLVFGRYRRDFALNLNQLPVMTIGDPAGTSREWRVGGALTAEMSKCRRKPRQSSGSAARGRQSRAESHSRSVTADATRHVSGTIRRQCVVDRSTGSIR
jgi:hypothetical protein